MTAPKQGKLLAVDIGNTNITIGAFDRGNLLHQWRLSSQPFRTVDEYAVTLTQILQGAGFEANRLILGSVVPPLEVEWERLASVKLGLEVRIVHPTDPRLMPLSVDHPEEVGVDRVVDSWCALQKFDAPLVVVDIGTATTFDVVGPDGDYQGGIILPGLELGAEALFRRTALLPQVTVKKPPSVIGKNTVDCIRSGLYFGWLEMIQGLVSRVKAEFSGKVTVVTTGGLARTFAEDWAFADCVEPNLTLEGLQLVDERWNDLRHGTT